MTARSFGKPMVLKGRGLFFSTNGFLVYMCTCMCSKWKKEVRSSEADLSCSPRVAVYDWKYIKLSMSELLDFESSNFHGGVYPPYTSNKPKAINLFIYRTQLLPAFLRKLASPPLFWTSRSSDSGYFLFIPTDFAVCGCMCQVTWMFDDVIICFQAIQLWNYYLTTSWPQVAGFNTKLTLLLFFGCHFWNLSCRPKTLMSFYDFFQGKTWDSPRDQKLRTVRRPLQNPPQNVIPKCEDFWLLFFPKKTRRSHGFCSWNQYETLEAEWSVGFWDVGSWCQPDTYAYSLAICLGDILGCQPGYKLIPEADFLFFPHLLEATQILKITKWNPSWSSYHPGWGKCSG